MVVERQHFAAVVGLGLVGQVVVVGVLRRRAGLDVHRDDAVGAAAVAAILDQRALHEAEQCLAVRRDGQAFHALVGHAARVIAGDLGGTRRRLVAHGQDRRQLEHAQALAGTAVELVEVRAVLVGDEHALAVTRDADALRVQPGVQRVRRRRRGVEVVRAAREVEATARVAGRGGAVAGHHATVVQGLAAVQQCGLGKHRLEREGQPGGCVRLALQVHLQRVEAGDVAGRVVDAGVPGDRIGAAIGQCQEGVAAGPGQAQADAAEQVGAHAVLEQLALARMVGAGSRQSADGDQINGLGSGARQCARDARDSE